MTTREDLLRVLPCIHAVAGSSPMDSPTPFLVTIARSCKASRRHVGLEGRGDGVSEEQGPSYNPA